MMSTPTYNMVVPSTGATVKYRPFLVKEEKALLLAQQSEDSMVMIDTLKNVIKSCVTDQLDINKLATFDLEYMFIQIRGKLMISKSKRLRGTLARLNYSEMSVLL